jgi:hypothetical protein
MYDAALPDTPGKWEPDVEAGEEQLRVALLLGQHVGVRIVLSPVARQDTVVGIFVVDKRPKQRVREIHADGVRGDEPTHAIHDKERRSGLFADDPSPGQSKGLLRLQRREPTKRILVVKHSALSSDDRAATRSHDRCLEPQVNQSGLRATGTNNQTWRQCRGTFEVRQPAEFRNVNGSARAKRRAVQYHQAATCAGGRGEAMPRQRDGRDEQDSVDKELALCLYERVQRGIVSQ